MNYKKWLMVLLGIIGINYAVAKVQWVDQIVVVVNQDVITQRDINDISNQIRRQTPGAELKKINLRQLAIDNLIQQRLLKQLAGNLQVTVSDAEIDAQIAKLAAANKMSSAQFYQRIAHEGVSKDMLRRTIKDNLMADKAVQEIAKEQNITASNEEITALLTENKITPTAARKQEAQEFIIRSKQQEILASVVDDLKKRAYIEYKEKPY